MKKPVAYLLAILLHVAVLFGITVSKTVPHAASPEKKYFEVLLTAVPSPAATLPAPAPPLKAEPLPPPPTAPPPPVPEPPPSPPTTIEEPVLAAMPEPTTAPSLMQNRLVAIPGAAPTPAPVAEQPVATSTPTLPAPKQYLNTSQPSFQNRVEPEYPLAARRQHQQGSVLLGLYLNELGSLDKVEIVKSSGYPLLDEAAVEAMKQSQFHPAYQDKTPVPSHAEVTITFRFE